MEDVKTKHLIVILLLCKCLGSTTSENIDNNGFIITEYSNTLAIESNVTQIANMLIDISITDSSFKNVSHTKFNEIMRKNRSLRKPKFMLHEIDYYPSTTYIFKIYFCKCKNSNLQKCDDHLHCVHSHILSYSTPPIKPNATLLHQFSTDDKYGFVVYVANHQLEDTFLYAFAKYPNATDFDVNVFAGGLSEGEIPNFGYVIESKYASGNASDIKRTIMIKQSEFCQYEILLIVANMYNDKFNSSVIQLEKNSACENFNDKFENLSGIPSNHGIQNVGVNRQMETSIAAQNETVLNEGNGDNKQESYSQDRDKESENRENRREEESRNEDKGSTNGEVSTQNRTALNNEQEEHKESNIKIIEERENSNGENKSDEISANNKTLVEINGPSIHEDKDEEIKDKKEGNAKKRCKRATHNKCPEDEGSETSSIKLKYAYITFGGLAIIAVLCSLFLIIFNIMKKGARSHSKANLEEVYIPLVDASIFHSLTTERLEHLFQSMQSNELKKMLTDEYEKVPECSRNTYGGGFYNKNRHTSILPYETNRVMLSLQPGDPNSDYINASYVMDRKYIAAQAPSMDTIDDFWRMIWEQKVSVIVMLANLMEDGRVKSAQYWPHYNEQSYGGVRVTLKFLKSCMDFVVRDFAVSFRGEKRNVKQVHFTSWPTKGTPLTPHSLVEVLKIVRKNKTDDPILVHCSAGLGRTGGFILADHVIDMAKMDKIDFPRALYDMRKHRKNLVSQKVYYLYSYCVVNEYFNGSTDSIILEEFKKNPNLDANESLRGIRKNDAWINLLHPCRGHRDWEANKKKHRTMLQQLTSRGFIGEGRYYLDAIEIPLHNKIIINTSQPLPNTLKDFWKMILEKDVKVILSLQSFDIADKTSKVFWPTNNQKINFGNSITLSLLQANEATGHDYYHVEVTDSALKWTRNVQILHFKSWYRNSLPNQECFLNFYKNFLLYHKSDSVAVCCHNAIEGCSTFLAFMLVMENLKQSLKFDVSTAVSTLQIFRRNLSVDEESVEFIQKSAHQFLTKDVNNYENLKQLHSYSERI